MRYKDIPIEFIEEIKSPSLSSISSHSSTSPHSIAETTSISSSDDCGPLPVLPEIIIMPVYEKIKVPTEQSLDELLKQVAGTSDLTKVTEIHLRVMSQMISLQRIHLFMPNLKSLNLDGSIVTSLRDLGCELFALQTLNISNCGLNNLDGSSGLGTVEELIADGNFIEDVSPCCNMALLKKVSFKR